MYRKRSLTFVIVFIVVVGVLFLTVQILQDRSSNISTFAQESSFLEFAKGISSLSKQEPVLGAFPGPPVEMIKKAEILIARETHNPVRASYKFISTMLDSGYTYNFTLELYTAPNPFSWRFDYMDDFQEGPIIYSYDGTNYHVCSSEIKGCSIGPDNFIEKYFTPPISLTNFLNDFLDPMSLKKLIPNTKESRNAEFIEYTEVISGYLGNCLIAEDEYSIFDYCLNEEEDILLFLDLKTKFSSGKFHRHHVVILEEIDFSDYPKDIFVSPSLD